ncbi:hypothetical protein F5883DRAFT_539097 [Diaporthe sp. PMI_573]|nr:hypothetical protein F5883DRAFT_539097 [Diaporthaceae sp. PMI_573]
MNTVSMFRKTFLIVFGVSSIFLISALLGTWAASMIGPYEAPLLACTSDDVIPGGYMVCLRRGYSLEKHQETIGIDLSSSIDLTIPEDSRHGLIYGGKLDDATLAAVRNDSGVKFVECDRKAQPAVLPAAVDL